MQSYLSCNTDCSSLWGRGGDGFAAESGRSPRGVEWTRVEENLNIPLPDLAVCRSHFSILGRVCRCVNFPEVCKSVVRSCSSISTGVLRRRLCQLHPRGTSTAPVGEELGGPHFESHLSDRSDGTRDADPVGRTTCGEDEDVTLRTGLLALLVVSLRPVHCTICSILSPFLGGHFFTFLGRTNQ